MESLTIGEACTRKSEAAGHHLYLYRTHVQVLYVGRSIHPFARLRQHMRGQDGWIGREIRRSRPGSLAWIVDVFTIEDCEPVVMEYRHSEYKHYWICRTAPGLWMEAAAIAEDALIVQHAPLYNIYGNFRAIEARRGTPEPTAAAPTLDLNDSAFDYVDIDA